MGLHFKILNAGRADCGPNWGNGITFLVPYCRFYFIENGMASIYLAGKKFALDAGNVYFIPRGISTKNECPVTARIIWTHFSANTYELEQLLNEIKTIHHWSFSRRDMENNNLLEMPDLVSGGGNPEAFGIYSIMYKLILELYKEYKNRISDNNLTYMKIKKAIDFMDNNYLNHPDLKTVAAKANMAPNYFHRIFKKVFSNMTPYKYMNNKIMSDALSLIKSGRQVKEIAEMLGYNDVFYFSRSFKKAFGYSPSESKTFKP